MTTKNVALSSSAMIDLLERNKAEARRRDEKQNENKDNELYKYTVTPNPSTPSPDALTTAIDELFDSKNNEITSLTPGNEYPTLFTRLPIFVPSHRKKQKNDLMDVNTAFHFSCPFGSGARKGPPLTTHDEDIFMALLRLRQNRVRGEAKNLPLDCVDYGKPIDVDHLVCGTADIVSVLGQTRNGRSYERVKTSVKNMAATTIELEQRIVDRYFGTLVKGRSVRLYQLSWLLGEEEGVFEIQFDPIVTRWLVHEFAFVDWPTRMKLKIDLSKALHRFLSSQPKHYTFDLHKIALSVGFAGRRDAYKERFTLALEELVSIGFLKSFKITGTGRRSPKVLEIFR